MFVYWSIPFECGLLLLVIMFQNPWALLLWTMDRNTDTPCHQRIQYRHIHTHAISPHFFISSFLYISISQNTFILVNKNIIYMYTYPVKYIILEIYLSHGFIQVNAKIVEIYFFSGVFFFQIQVPWSLFNVTTYVVMEVGLNLLTKPDNAFL